MIFVSAICGRGDPAGRPYVGPLTALVLVLAETMIEAPASLKGAPFLLPMDNTTLRRSLDQRFETEGIRPTGVGEFEDSALLKVFGQAEADLFVAPSVIEVEVRQQYGVEVDGRVEAARERFYAILVERSTGFRRILPLASVGEAQAEQEVIVRLGLASPQVLEQGQLHRDLQENPPAPGDPLKPRGRGIGLRWPTLSVPWIFPQSSCPESSL